MAGVKKGILTPKQEAFAQAVVLNGGDKVSAYKSAGYSTNMNAVNMGIQADKIYNRPSVYLRIEDLLGTHRDVAKEEFKIDSNYVISRLHEIDQLDIIDIMKTAHSGFKLLNEWPKSWRISISGIDLKRIMQSEDVETIIDKVKWPDKVKNLDMIGKHISVKAWDKEVEVQTTVSNIMPVPCATSVDAWEDAAKEQQDKILNNG